MKARLWVIFSFLVSWSASGRKEGTSLSHLCIPCQVAHTRHSAIVPVIASYLGDNLNPKYGLCVYC